ncbi:hypothetical protein [Paenibacillus turpanensis]
MRASTQRTLAGIWLTPARIEMSSRTEPSTTFTASPAVRPV